MAFKDYVEFTEPLVLPYNGKPYSLPPVGIQEGIRLTQVFDPESDETLDDIELQQILLGDAFAEMKKDNVPAGFILRCTLTALADFQGGRLVAEGVWETGADPKALQKWVGNRLELDATTDSAAAPTTKSRASGSTTTSKRRTTAKK